jgi:ribosomal-protein-alanine N-acetyltransferase
MNALLQLNWVRRGMTVGDLDAIMAVEVLAYSHPWTRGNFIDSLAAGYLAEVLEARDAGLVGYFVAMPGVDELHLLNITIAPAWQSQGLGRALLDTVQDHGRVRGDEKLWLEVRQSNHRARALYRRRGFAEMGLRRGYYPAGAREREDAVVMSLSLTGGGAHGVE